MKARLIVAGIWIPILLVVFLLCPVWAAGILVGGICAFCTYELIHSTGTIKSTRILVIAVLMSCFISAWRYFDMPGMWMRIGIVVFSVYLFVELLIADLKLPFTGICIVLFSALLVPYLLGAMTEITKMEHGRFYILMPFFMTMIPDSFAFLIGRKLGKHKCFPHMSPKKSTEGVIAGLASGIIFMVLYGVVLDFFFGFTVNYLYAAIYGLVGAAGSVVGDLVFSVIKRQHDIKDFGKILPGHGGMMDRFDSMVVVAPIAELLLLYIPMAV